MDPSNYSTRPFRCRYELRLSYVNISRLTHYNHHHHVQPSGLFMMTKVIIVERFKRLAGLPAVWSHYLIVPRTRTLMNWPKDGLLMRPRFWWASMTVRNQVPQSPQLLLLTTWEILWRKSQRMESFYSGKWQVHLEGILTMTSLFPCHATMHI